MLRASAVRARPLATADWMPDRLPLVNATRQGFRARSSAASAWGRKAQPSGEEGERHRLCRLGPVTGGRCPDQRLAPHQRTAAMAVAAGNQDQIMAALGKLDLQLA